MSKCTFRTACRVIIDPAHRPLPPVALVNLRADGTPEVAAVLRSVIRQPAAIAAAGWPPMCAQLGSRRGRLGTGLCYFRTL